MDSGITTSFTPLSSIVPIQGWRDFLEDGRAYLKTADAAYAGRREIFSASILYNIIAMAIEKFVMAVLMRHGTMPCNHTMTDLAHAVEEVFPGALGEMRENLPRLDAYQEICDPYDINVADPDMLEIPGMLELAARVRQLVDDMVAGTDKQQKEII